jgi:hypothetical protein
MNADGSLKTIKLPVGPTYGQVFILDKMRDLSPIQNLKISLLINPVFKAQPRYILKMLGVAGFVSYIDLYLN